MFERHSGGNDANEGFDYYRDTADSHSINLDVSPIGKHVMNSKSGVDVVRIY